jgi:hypothetical protein
LFLRAESKGRWRLLHNIGKTQGTSGSSGYRRADALRAAGRYPGWPARPTAAWLGLVRSERQPSDPVDATRLVHASSLPLWTIGRQPRHREPSAVPVSGSYGRGSTTSDPGDTAGIRGEGKKNQSGLIHLQRLATQDRYEAPVILSLTMSVSPPPWLVAIVRPLNRPAAVRIQSLHFKGGASLLSTIGVWTLPHPESYPPTRCGLYRIIRGLYRKQNTSLILPFKRYQWVARIIPWTLPQIPNSKYKYLC